MYKTSRSGLGKVDFVIFTAVVCLDSCLSDWEFPHQQMFAGCWYTSEGSPHSGIRGEAWLCAARCQAWV